MQLHTLSSQALSLNIDQNGRATLSISPGACCPAIESLYATRQGCGRRCDLLLHAGRTYILGNGSSQRHATNAVSRLQHVDNILTSDDWMRGVGPSGGQRVTDRGCSIRSRWESRVDFGNVTRWDRLIAVGRGLRLWVDS